ncbi:DUF2079 domain-containing protein [Streptomyces olivoreticuli]
MASQAKYLCASRQHTVTFRRSDGAEVRGLVNSPRPGGTARKPTTLNGRHAGIPINPADSCAASERIWPWWAWAAGLFVLYAAFSLNQHYHLRTTGYDLGIFEQAVRGYAHFHAPIADLKGPGFNLYGDHFHPILMALVPLYWTWPHAETLLIAQAALVAAAAVPLARLAARRIGRPAGHAVAAAYGLSFGVQGAVSFDFHEVAFAVPLLAFSLTALSKQRWRVSVTWALPLLLVKEELSLTVAAIGVVLFWRRQRRLAFVLLGSGLITFALVVGVVIPAFNPLGIYPYLHPAAAGGSLRPGVSLWDRLTGAPTLLFSPSTKATTLLLLAMVSCLLSLRSSLLVVALPNIVVRFLSDNPSYWGTSLHYNLTLMPVLFAAALDAQPVWLRSRLPLARGIAQRAGAAMLVAAAPLSSLQPLQDFVLHPRRVFASDTHTQAAYTLMRRIPDGVTVEATNHLSPHLTDRTRVFTWPLADFPVDWAILALNEHWPRSPHDFRTHLKNLLAHGYQQVDARQDLVLLRRAQHTPPPPHPSPSP